MLTTEDPLTTVPAPRATVEVQVATPPGRRRAVLITDDEDEAPVSTGAGRRRRVEPQPTMVQSVVAPAAPASGSGRRRKPSDEQPAESTEVPSGRRRKAPATEVPAVTSPAEVPAAGNGRRRRVAAESEFAADPAVDPALALARHHSVTARRAPVARHTPAGTPGEAAEAAPRRATPAAPVVAGSTVGVPSATPRSMAPAKVAAAPAVGMDTATPVADVVPIAAGRTHRHRAKAGFPLPGNPALVAGAAAVAIAAVGAVAAAAGGTQSGAAGADLAKASSLGLDRPVAAAAAAPDPTAAERASRDHARDLLALRLKNDAKQDVLAKALKLAQQRAARLAALAKLFFLPVKGYHLTAGFGEGGGLWSHGHTGQDFACATGTPIHALASGTIVYTGWYGAYGWLTVERLADNTEIWYAHQSKILVHSGPVVAGQVIGRVGSTGNTTGPHLHLEVHPQGGPPVDPMPWLRAHGMHP